MSKKTAFISGINGQIGSYLAEYLISKEYTVYGMIRRNSISENQTYRIVNIRNKLQVDYADITDISSIINLLRISKPDKILHLAAMSHVKISFSEPIYTTQVNAVGTLNLIEAARLVCPEAKIYNSSSSEMFGNTADLDGFQRETTHLESVSPYGASKVFAHNICRNYRAAYNMFISNGILFNTESIRRGENFVTAKVVKGAVEIFYKKQSKLVLGNLEAKRDWGNAKDSVRAMDLILDHSEPDDFVIATGKNYSVRDLCQYVFSKLGLNYLDYVVSSDTYKRPEELNELKGDSTKIRTLLGWKPEYTFEQTLDEMIEHYLVKLKE